MTVSGDRQTTAAELDAAGVIARLEAQVSLVLRGKPEAVRLAVVSLLSGGHATYGGLRTFEPYDGKLKGAYKSSGLRPHFLPRAAYFALDRSLMEAMG